MSSIIKLLRTLISIPSVTGDIDSCQNAVAVISSLLTPAFAKEEYKHDESISTLFYSKRFTSRTPFEIILNAHLDVVPAKAGQFSAEEKDGKLYGRGAQDMKAGAAVMVEVFRKLSDVISYPLALQIVTDEETGGIHGVQHQLNSGVTANFVISGESTQLDIVHKAKGIMRVKLVTKGMSAHSAYPWNGTNAIVKMSELLDKIKRIFPPVSESMWKSSYNPATIETTNTASNVIPDNCTCTVDVRYVKEDLDRLKRQLEQLNTETCNVSIEYIEPAHDSNERDLHIQKLGESVKKVTGHLPTLRGAHGASDVRHFDERGIVGVEFGPVGAGLHTDSEWVDLKSLELYEKILTDFLLSLEAK